MDQVRSLRLQFSQMTVVPGQGLPRLAFQSQSRLKLTFLTGFAAISLAQAGVRSERLTGSLGFQVSNLLLDCPQPITQPDLALKLLAELGLLGLNPGLFSPDLGL
jgi:hypothetical protein